MPSNDKPADGFSRPEDAARELLRIAKTLLAKSKVPHTYTGVWNMTFILKSTVENYTAGRDYALKKGWISIDRSGTQLKVLQAGEEEWAAMGDCT